MDEAPARTAAPTADWVFAIILLVAQGVGSLLVGMVSMLLMMISDGCMGNPDDAFICSEAGGLVFFGGLFLEWALLAAGFVVSIALLDKARKSPDRSPTVQVLKGIGIGLIGMAVMVATAAISSS